MEETTANRLAASIDMRSDTAPSHYREHDPMDDANATDFSASTSHSDARNLLLYAQIMFETFPRASTDA